MNRLTEKQVLRLLQGRIRYDYSQQDMARDAGVSDAFVSMVLAGKKRPGPRLLGLVGVEATKTIRYTYAKRPHNT